MAKNSTAYKGRRKTKGRLLTLTLGICLLWVLIVATAWGTGRENAEQLSGGAPETAPAAQTLTESGLEGFYFGVWPDPVQPPRP